MLNAKPKILVFLQFMTFKHSNGEANQLVCVRCSPKVLCVNYLLGNFGNLQTEFFFIDSNFMSSNRESWRSIDKKGYVLKALHLSRHNQEIHDRITCVCEDLWDANQFSDAWGLLF